MQGANPCPLINLTKDRRAIVVYKVVGSLEYITGRVSRGHLELKVPKEKWDNLSPDEKLELLSEDGELVIDDTSIEDIGPVYKFEAHALDSSEDTQEEQLPMGGDILYSPRHTFALGLTRGFSSPDEFLDKLMSELKLKFPGSAFTIPEVKKTRAVFSEVEIPKEVMAVVDEGPIAIHDIYAAEIEWSVLVKEAQ